MLKEILFTHDDLDGAGCRVIYELAHMHMHNAYVNSDTFEVRNCHLNSLDDDVNDWLKTPDANPNEVFVMFADLVCDASILEAMRKRHFRVKILDHHQTNKAATSIFPHSVVREYNKLGRPECGTSLMYQYYLNIAMNNPKDPHGIYFGVGETPSKHFEYIDTGARGNHNLIEKFVDTVRSYDTWEWKSTNNILAKKLNALLYLLGMDRFCNRYTTRLADTNNGYDLIIPSDMEFVDAKLSNEQDAIDKFDDKRIIPINVRNMHGALLIGNIGANFSDFGNQFCENHPEYDFICKFTLNDYGRYEFRCTRDDINLGEVLAAPMGGGGHPKAAGAIMSEESRFDIIDIIVHEMMVDKEPK